MFQFANLQPKRKDMKKLVSALENAGMRVSITPGKHHIKIVNPNTKQMTFIGSQPIAGSRAGKNALRDLRRIGFKSTIKL